VQFPDGKKGKGSPYSITERRVPELIPVLGSQPGGDVSHKSGGRLPLFSARRAVTLATFLGLLYRFCRLVNRGTMGVNSLPKTVYPTVSRLRFEPGRSAPEFSTLTTRLPSHPCYREENFQDGTARCWPYIRQLFFDIFECLINN